jgi:hypothetical protein
MRLQGATPGDTVRGEAATLKPVRVPQRSARQDTQVESLKISMHQRRLMPCIHRLLIINSTDSVCSF